MYDPDKVTYFAQTDARNKRVPFGIRAEDRTRHLYVIGKTGMGKSVLLENMAAQDILNGNGMCFMDPHGSAIDELMEYIPKERQEDVLYFAPFDIEHPVSFNVLEDVGYDKRHLVVAGLMSTFKKIWQDAWSARMEYILQNTLLALLEYPGSTLLSVNKMLSDKKFREKVVDNLTDLAVKSFWVDEFAKYTERMQAESVPAIQNKIGQFTANPIIRNILGQPKSTFDIRDLMDNKKIMLVNLSKGRIGETNAQLLGGMLVTKIYLAAMSRADVTTEELKSLPNFYLFVDEFQSFANESFADILSEARKYKLNLNIAHQYIEQMPEEVRYAVFGNVGTMITFRVGATDAEYLEKELAPTFLAQDLVNLNKFQIYLKLMINGVGSQPFSAATLPPIKKPENTNIQATIEASRRKYSRPRAFAEKQIMELIGLGRDNEAPQKVQEVKDQKRVDKKQKREQKSDSDFSHQNSNSNNSNHSKRIEKENEERKPMIDEETKRQLEMALSLKTEKKKETPGMADKSVEEESLSLQNLAKNSRRKVSIDDPKQVSPENRGGLKEALAAALGGKKEENVNSKNNSDSKQGTDKPKEIASEDLKAILES